MMAAISASEQTWGSVCMCNNHRVCLHICRPCKTYSLDRILQARTDLRIQVTLSKTVVHLIKASSSHYNKLFSVAVSSPG